MASRELRERKPSVGNGIAVESAGELDKNKHAAKTMEPHYMKTTTSQTIRVQSSAPVSTVTRNPKISAGTVTAMSSFNSQTAKAQASVIVPSAARNIRISGAATVQHSMGPKAAIVTPVVSVEHAHASAVLHAHYVRKRCKLLDQREKAEKQCRERLTKLESLLKVQEERKKRLVTYKAFTYEAENLRVVLAVLTVHLPFLLQVGEKGPQLQAKVCRFTKALKQFLACVMAVNENSVKMPKTDAETDELVDNIRALNQAAMALTSLLITNLDKNDQNGKGNIVVAATSMITAVETFFSAFIQLKENNALMEKVEKMKTTEAFLKGYSGQLGRQVEILR